MNTKSVVYKNTNRYYVDTKGLNCEHFASLSAHNTDNQLLTTAKRNVACILERPRRASDAQGPQ